MKYEERNRNRNIRDVNIRRRITNSTFSRIAQHFGQIPNPPGQSAFPLVIARKLALLAGATLSSVTQMHTIRS